MNLKNMGFIIPFYHCLICLFCMACQQKHHKDNLEGGIQHSMVDYNSYGGDIKFLTKYMQIIQLHDSLTNSMVAVSPALQGRVMTSSASGLDGRSYGWINKALFKSGDTLEHINVYGGEERFWLGPEGGQYSIFFKKGAEFKLEDWYTPRLIDLEPFEVESVSPEKVLFTKRASIVNYSGFQFNFDIEREVAILSTQEMADELDISNPEGLKATAYRTTNTIINTSEVDWKKTTGLLSIWLLGMFNPSPTTTIIIPYRSNSESERGTPVNDTYFGKVPAERLAVGEEVIFFRGDGQYRSKIGLSPVRAKDILGSYDTKNGILTIVTYNKPPGVMDYVNSLWELQDNPFAGDVINSYNDGPPEPGKKPLGPFYELETSSPALALKAGESGTHIQLTCHFEGNPEELNPIITKLLGTTINEIKNVFE